MRRFLLVLSALLLVTGSGLVAPRAQIGLGNLPLPAIAGANVTLDQNFGLIDAATSEPASGTIAPSAGANALIIAFNYQNTGITGFSCTWNGNAPTGSGNASDTARQTYLLWWLNSSTGSHTISCSWSSGGTAYLSGVSYKNVQAIGTFQNNTATSATASVTLSCPHGASDMAVTAGVADGASHWSSTNAPGTNIFNSITLPHNAWADYWPGTVTTAADTLSASSTAWLQVGICVEE